MIVKGDAVNGPHAPFLNSLAEKKKKKNLCLNAALTLEYYSPGVKNASFIVSFFSSSSSAAIQGSL